MPFRIALFLMNSGDYQELLWDDCVRAAHPRDVEVRAFWADNDSQKQLRQIQSCLNEGEEQRPTVLLVSPVREMALINSARVAASLGIGWVLLLRYSDYLNALRNEFPTVPIFSVTADQREVGRIQGRQFRALLPRGGRLVYIRGPLGTSSAINRFAGVQELLQGSSIELVTLNADWTAEGGARALSEWMRGQGALDPSTLLVAAQNDAMAMGARRALEEIGKQRAGLAWQAIRVCGCDGSPRFGQRLVSEGKLTSTVVVPPVAGRAVDEIATMLERGARPPVVLLLNPTSCPDLETLAATAA
jgi:ABC-type sugar transport system substrate-binding protein